MPTIVTERDRERWRAISNGPWAVDLDHPLAEAFQLGSFVMAGHVIQVGSRVDVLEILSPATTVARTEPARDGRYGLSRTVTTSASANLAEVYTPVATPGVAGNAGSLHVRVEAGANPTLGTWLAHWRDSAGWIMTHELWTGNLHPRSYWATAPSASSSLSSTGDGLWLGRGNPKSITLTCAGNSPSPKALYMDGISLTSATTSNGVRGTTGPLPADRQWIRFGYATSATANWSGPTDVQLTEMWASRRALSADEVAYAHEQPFWWLARLQRRRVFVPSGGTTYNDSDSDTVSTSESDTVALTAVEAASDTVSLSESDAATLTAVEATSDTISLFESDATTLAAAGAASDTASVSESDLAALTTLDSDSDTVSLTETTGDWISYEELHGDTISTAESSVLGVIFGPADSDSVSLSESVSVSGVYGVATLDGISFTETDAALVVSGEAPPGGTTLTTARELVEHAFREINVLGRSSSLSADDAANGLYWLRNTLDELAAENKIGVPTVRRQDIALIAGQGRYVYDPGGAADIAARPPEEVTIAALRDADGRDFPVGVWPLEQYEALRDKARSGRPYGLYYEQQTALNLYPVPDRAYTLRLWGYVPGTLPTNLSDAIAYPSDWETLIIMRLALALAGPYSKTMSAESRAKLQRAESRSLRSRGDDPVMNAREAALSSSGGYNVWAG